MAFAKFLMGAACVGTALVATALAQERESPGPPCAERSHVAAQLREAFGERMIGSGLAESGVLFEIYVSPSGTWTLLATTPVGTSCLVGAGEAWDPLPEPDAYAAR